MKLHPFFSLRLFLLLFLFLALPALACSTLAGDDAADGGDSDAGSATVSDSTTGADDGASPSETIGDGDTSSSVSSEPSDSTSAGSSTDDSESSSTGDGDSSVSGADGGSEGSSGSSGDQSSGSDTPAGDPQEAIFGALSTGLEVDAIRITLVNNLDGQESEAILEFVRPDRYHLVSEGVEFIIIGSNTYLKAPESDWIETPMSDSVQPLVDEMLSEAAMNQDIDELVGSIDDVQFLGRETFNGVETLVYEYSQVTPGGEINQTAKIWIGADDGRLYRQEVSGDFSGQSINSSIQYEYGSDIVIEPPI